MQLLCVKRGKESYKKSKDEPSPRLDASSELYSIKDTLAKTRREKDELTHENSNYYNSNVKDAI